VRAREPGIGATALTGPDVADVRWMLRGVLPVRASSDSTPGTFAVSLDIKNVSLSFAGAATAYLWTGALSIKAAIPLRV